MRTWWAETVGGLPRTFWYLWVGTLINRAGGFVVIYLAVYLTVVRDFPAGFVGMVVGLHGAGGAVGAVIGGVLADRWGRRPTLLLGHFGASAAALSLGMVSGPIAIALLTVAFGVCMGMSRPAFNATVIDVVPEDDRLREWLLGEEVAALVHDEKAWGEHHHVAVVYVGGHAVWAVSIEVRLDSGRVLGVMAVVE